MTISEMKRDPKLSPIEISIAGKKEETPDVGGKETPDASPELSGDCDDIVPQLIKTENVQKVD